MNLDQLKTSLPRKARKYDPGKELFTRWGKQLKEQLEQENLPAGSIVLPEYPRPQLVREQGFQSLNGWWEYAFTESSARPDHMDGTILVPFSPETSLSGVRRQLQPDEYLWYKKSFENPLHNDSERLLLHFGAVDQICRVYCNGKAAGSHRGGYLPFTLELTDLLREGSNELLLCVKDCSDTSFQTRGKQKLERGGMFYTAQSGIWQCVWLETVPGEYIDHIRITPDWDKQQFEVSLTINTGRRGTLSEKSIKAVLYQPVLLNESHSDEKAIWKQDVLTEMTTELTEEVRLILPISNTCPWTPEQPWLYGIRIETGDDCIFTYSAMRCFTCERDEKGIQRICLNHMLLFMNGVLDQGYWPESLMTPPADDALIYDIQSMKKHGFNMLRKHCKLEPFRFYYHCDRLGMLVWQDMVNGGYSYDMMKVCYLPTAFPSTVGRWKDTGQTAYKRCGRKTAKSRKVWKDESAETIRTLYSFPCIAAWVLFNEGWGQFDSEDNCAFVRSLDHTRILDAASGWFDQGAGDLRSVHNYFRKLKTEKDDRAFVISEYGGFGYFEKDHSLQDQYYGYGLMKDRRELRKRFQKTMKELMTLRQEGLCAAVYTQVSDIEDECNGILTYDREIDKLEQERR